MANFVSNKNVSKSLSIASGPKSLASQPLRPITSNKWEVGKGTSGKVASFLIKTIALETVRRFQGPSILLSGLGCKVYKFFVIPRSNGFSAGSLLGSWSKECRLFFKDCSNFLLDDTENSPSNDDSQLSSESLSGSPSLQCNQSMRIGDENPQDLLSTDWLNHLCRELENQGITLPERGTPEIYVAANGDLPSLLSSVKKTIRWRETYRILSEEELERWSNMIFWHGLDVKNRPCLIVRLGLACISLPSHDRPRFAQAVVSQVEHGVLHLVDGENPQITVLVDCQGLSPLRFPMQTMRYCCNLLQDHFPNVLGCLIIIRLPSVVRVIAQTFIQVLKPATKQKLRIEGEAYRKVLSECFQTLPSYLGGLCTCERCAMLDAGIPRLTLESPIGSRESVPDIVNLEDFGPTYQYDMIMDGYCSQTIRTAVIGILIIWVLIAFIEGIYNPESRPSLPP
ncbi:UNVERIFIED_CONTAM: hypothetical protein Scaly_0874500 [Sesamum calycinum]|uniref:CRAL-TRIO domain-containing protein n=1 Tax=Sesamum calycinum TaxID=2727403 RepID=A0AAW2QWE8_9LAMI